GSRAARFDPGARFGGIRPPMDVGVRRLRPVRELAGGRYRRLRAGARRASSARSAPDPERQEPVRRGPAGRGVRGLPAGSTAAPDAGSGAGHGGAALNPVEEVPPISTSRPSNHAM